MDKNELKKMLASAPKTVVTIFRAKVTDVTIAVGEGVVAEAIAEGQAALKRGKTVEWADGTKQWETTIEVMDTEAEGSAMFTWDATGERILHQVFLCTKQRDGTFDRQFVRNSWRLFE